MKFVNTEAIANALYETHPYPHAIIENFLKEECLSEILASINNLKDETADSKFIHPESPYEFNKYAFSHNYGELLKEVFVEMNSPEFVSYLEKLTGIQGLLTGDITLQGAGIHRIKREGRLQLHTDFNSYVKNGVKLDRRINLLIYMNPDWKPEYNGDLCICDKATMTCVKKVAPLLNRCLIFNTSNKSIHGHPVPLSVPDTINRQSIAVYYYTKNTNGDVDFEGDPVHNTVWYPQIKV